MPNENQINKQARKLRDVMTHINDMMEFINKFDAAKHVNQIPSRLEDLEQTKMEFRSIRDILVHQAEDTEMIESLAADRREFEQKYHEIKGFFSASNPDRRTATSEQYISSSFNTTQPKVRLPKIELPTFDGDTTKWLTFKDRFESLVHTASDVPEVLKLQYLLSALKGELASQYDHTQHTADNYEPTWDSLVKRFDHEKRIKREYFKAFAALEAMKNSSADEWQHIVNESNRLVNGMERLEEPVKMWNTPLTSLLFYKLDGDTLMAWEEYSADEKADKFPKLIEFLERWIRILNSSKVGEEGAFDKKAATNAKVTRNYVRGVSMVAGLPAGMRHSIDQVASSSSPTPSSRPCEIAIEMPTMPKKTPHEVV
ncbi:uncharacterized protein LOC133393224 [Anopheles gambiae]|uniref:uncharacterized protein LOC133393224 n=2 Tax=Anopheles gambiae TaxID=7165 RepID=UPI002AC9D007|nr:uncharacterized protein LOC133393224 [Anopheles gambiae]